MGHAKLFGFAGGTPYDPLAKIAKSVVKYSFQTGEAIMSKISGLLAALTLAAALSIGIGSPASADTWQFFPPAVPQTCRHFLV